MAEQKKTNEALNVEDALTQSEAFFIKNKKAIIGAVVAVIIIIAGVVMYKKHRFCRICKSGRRIQRHKSSQSCKSLYGSLLCTPRQI